MCLIQEHISLKSHCLLTFINLSGIHNSCLGTSLRMISTSLPVIVDGRRVRVVGSVCLCVYVESHLTSGASIRILSRNQWAMEVKNLWFFFLKPLHCGAHPQLKAIRTVAHFSSRKCVCTL